MTREANAELLPLGELGDIASGATPKTGVKEYWNGDIPWITPADLTNHEGVWFRGKLKRISKLGFEACSTRMLPRGSILFSSRAPIGHCAVAAYPLCTNQGFKSLVPNQRLDSVYGYFALRAVTPSIVSQGRGATFAEVSKEIMESVRIPVRPLPEQKRIAALLENTDGLRRTRRYARQLSDTFLQSVFLEMFGDPSRAASSLMLVPLESLCSRITDGTHQTPTYRSSGVPFLSVKNVNTPSGELDFKGVKYISLEDHRELTKRCKPERDDILYTKVGATYGIPKRISTECEFSIFVSLALLKPIKELILPTFLEEVLRTNFVKAQADRLVSGIGVPDLHLREIKSFQIPLPSLPLQQKFTAIVRRFERLRAQQREAERQAEHLFQTLLRRAFKEGGL
jgi:type I restriction enzyme S subunit